MIKWEFFTPKQEELYQLMSDISEDCWCAGWMMGNELSLWSSLQGGELSYGMAEIEKLDLERLRALSTELDGWIIWLDDDYEPNLPNDQWGPRFISLDDWKARLAKLNDPIFE